MIEELNCMCLQKENGVSALLTRES
ncbi:hypothetical protein OIU74_003358 [Salix koriyanagi]|uniref:Uncharacterized protein n=1 Tax=Salix koriyanagi TaxID=2511006 RepID=A0A9Q0UXS7_9ROSI|nr:hypothetical protein OIU74_003358 [Salix koriyanagi]